LERLINATISKSIDQTSQNALIKCLYPAKPVSSDLIYSIISSLGHGTLKASVPTQQALIKWLIMTYEFQEDTAALSKCYGVLFNLLDTTSLRAELCHLLSIITRKKHVKPFRIMLLNDLSITAGQEPALQKVLLVYEGYAPKSMNVGKVSQKVSLGFASPDAEWSARLDKIQENTKLQTENPTVQDLVQEDSSTQAIHDSSNTTNKVKSNSTEKHHEVITSLSKPFPTELTLSDLSNRTFQSHATLMPADDLAARLHDLLTPIFEQQLNNLESGRETETEKALANILEKVLIFTKFTKVYQSSPLLPSKSPKQQLKKTQTLSNPAFQFFESYLPKWNGQTHQKTILTLLSYIPILPYEGKPPFPFPSPSPPP